MLGRYLTRCARITLLSAALLPTGSALANINLPGGDIFLDGSFQGMTYGTAGSANLSPLLYIGDFGSTLPPLTQIIGTGLDFPIPTPGFGSSVVTFSYSLTNNESQAYTDLRFMLDLKTKGQPATLDVGAAHGFGGSAGAGDPDTFQIFDFDAPGDKPIQRISTANGLNGNIAPTCLTGCFSDLALQWNLAELGAGETWHINVTLTDDPSLVVGGRYLTATSLGTNGTQIIFGNPQLVPEPETYAMLLAGLGLLALLRMRRT